MTKEDTSVHPKKWGKEIWIVNNENYCSKLLYVDKNGEASFHLHRKKRETFYGLNGQVILTVDDKDYMLNPFSRPKTIEPGTPHKFRAITDAIILEVSTPHDEADVFRATESKEGYDYAEG